MPKVFVPLDTSAVAAGADAVAAAFREAGVEVVRNGSRGMAWAEPLVELQGDERLAFANVAADDVLDIVRQGERHPKCQGPVSGVPYLAGQTRAVFDRIGEDAPLELPKTTALEECLDTSPHALIATIERSGLRGRGGAGFPAHIKWRTVAETPAEQKYIVCNADEGRFGHVCGPPVDGSRSLPV